MKKEILRMDNIFTKSYDKTNLNNFNMNIFEREIVGMIGINGKGKDLLVDLIYENNKIDYGRIYFQEKLINSFDRKRFRSVNSVYILDIKSKLIDELSIEENIFVVRKGYKKFWVSRRLLKIQAQMFFDELGIDIDLTKRCEELSVYEKCLVEIVMGLIQKNKLLIINDLSNFLNRTEWQMFKKVLANILQYNIGILYIGIHHEQVFSLCDRVLLIKDGTCVKILDSNSMLSDCVRPYYNLKEINGHSQLECFVKLHIKYSKHEEIKMEQGKGWCNLIIDPKNYFGENISKLVLGEKSDIEGSLEFDDYKIELKYIDRYIAKDIVFLEQNALYEMLYYNMSYIDNLCLWLENKLEKRLSMRRLKDSVRKEYEPIIGEDIYSHNLRAIGKESLYNLLYYKIYLLNPKILFLRNPFQNVDMHLREHIYKLIEKIKAKGVAVVIFSVCLADSLNVANEVYYVEENHQIKKYLPDQFSEIEFL